MCVAVFWIGHLVLCRGGVTEEVCGGTEVPSSKSQPGTLTRKFLFFLSSRGLWAKGTEILCYRPQLNRQVAKHHYRWYLLLMSKQNNRKIAAGCSIAMPCLKNSPNFHSATLYHLSLDVWYMDGWSTQTISFSKKDHITHVCFNIYTAPTAALTVS